MLKTQNGRDWDKGKIKVLCNIISIKLAENEEKRLIDKKRPNGSVHSLYEFSRSGDVLPGCPASFRPLSHHLSVAPSLDSALNGRIAMASTAMVDASSTAPSPMNAENPKVLMQMPSWRRVNRWRCLLWTAKGTVEGI